MQAEEHRGDVRGQEHVDQVGEGVIVMSDEGEGRGGAVLPGRMQLCEGRLRGVEQVAVDEVGEDFAQEEGEEEVFDDAPWHGRGSGDFQGGAEVQDVREEQLRAQLEGDAEEHIAQTDQGHLPPSAFPAALGFAHGERGVAMLFDPDGEVGHRAVEDEEGQGGKDVEDEADAQRAQKLDFQWVIRSDEDGPCHVEEQKVDGGPVAGEGGDDEEGEGGDVEESVHWAGDQIVWIAKGHPCFIQEGRLPRERKEIHEARVLRVSRLYPLDRLGPRYTRCRRKVESMRGHFAVRLMRPGPCFGSMEYSMHSRVHSSI